MSTNNDFPSIDAYSTLILQFLIFSEFLVYSVPKVGMSLSKWSEESIYIKQEKADCAKQHQTVLSLVTR